MKSRNSLGQKPKSGLIDERSLGLFLDYYELTMAKADLDNNNLNTITENYYIRKIPQGSYLITVGLEQAINFIQNFRVSKEDIEWLRNTSGRDFDEGFLKYLLNLNFTGDVYAIPEGTVVFPNEPIMNVTGPSPDVQLFETYILNVMNFQTLIATKTSRMVWAARGRNVIDFGARGAHGRDAAVLGARAAFIGGATGTSLVMAGKIWSIPYVGTMAHKFIQDRHSELEAFREYVGSFPHNAILLIDTYETLAGARNACVVGKELRKRGFELGGVRLDSGNLLELSKKVRAILDGEGLEKTKIFASGELDEYVIHNLIESGAPIDGFGVGTRLMTGANYDPLTDTGGVSALNGIYKIVERIEEGKAVPKFKTTDDLSKATFPGRKQVYRRETSGEFAEDLVTLWDEKPESEVEWQPLLIPIVIKGETVYDFPRIKDLKEYASQQLSMLPEQFRRLHQPGSYPMRISRQIIHLREQLWQEYENTNLATEK
jgi:nicotinate phosphoribosyltransferase